MSQSQMVEVYVGYMKGEVFLTKEGLKAIKEHLKIN